jgi:hypothetical protein
MSSIRTLLKLRGKRPSWTAVYIQTFFLDAGVTKVRRKQIKPVTPAFQEWLRKWGTGYDRRKVEAKLNALPIFLPAEPGR